MTVGGVRGHTQAVEGAPSLRNPASSAHARLLSLDRGPSRTRRQHDGGYFSVALGNGLQARPPLTPADPRFLLQCKKAEQKVKAYLKAHLPKRLHFANSRRIEDVSVLVDLKWLFER